MGKNKISKFFLLLIAVALIWTIYSNFIKDKQETEGLYFADQNEYIDFLAQNLGIEEPEILKGPTSSEAHEHEMIETTYQSVNLKAADFQLKTLDDKIIKLSDLQGKKVFINFWASWCPPCKAEMPDLNTFYEEYAEKYNVEILAVNITDQELTVSDVEKFAKEHNVKFPILLDEKGTVSMEYKIMMIPTSFIINEEGKVIEKIVGPVTKDILLQKFQE